MAASAAAAVHAVYDTTIRAQPEVESAVVKSYRDFAAAVLDVEFRFLFTACCYRCLTTHETE